MKTLVLAAALAATAQAATITAYQPTPHADEVSLDAILDSRFGVGQWAQRPDPGVFPLDLVLIETIASYAAASQRFFTAAVPGGFVACDESTGFPQVGTACSDPAINPGGMVQVLQFDFGHAIQFVLAFEDWPATYNGLPANSDRDYNDFVVIVEKQQPVGEVPEPGTLALLGAGLLGLKWLRRRLC